MTLREQFERTLRLTLMVFVLAAAGFLSALTAIRIAIRGRIVAMPNLVGQPASQAEQELAERGLHFRVDDRVYGSLPVNAVVRQSPPPGEQMKVAQDAHAVLSLGPQKITVPAIEGHSLRAGRIALLQAGLQLGEVSEVDMPAVEPETVLRQDPPAGTSATTPRVDLLVAEGEPPAAYVMPMLVGLQQQDAERILTGAGLRITKVTHIAQTGAAKGNVVGQVPPPGERISGEVTVEIGVAE